MEEGVQAATRQLAIGLGEFAGPGNDPEINLQSAFEMPVAALNLALFIRSQSGLPVLCLRLADEIPQRGKHGQVGDSGQRHAGQDERGGSRGALWFHVTDSRRDFVARITHSGHK